MLCSPDKIVMNRPEREGSQALRRILEKLEELSTDDYFREKKILVVRERKLL
jgi:hypothetical protein